MTPLFSAYNQGSIVNLQSPEICLISRSRTTKQTCLFSNTKKTGLLEIVNGTPCLLLTYCKSIFLYPIMTLPRDNIDGCQYAKNCPLQSGNLTLKLPLDLSQYAAIINLLTDKVESLMDFLTFFML